MERRTVAHAVAIAMAEIAFDDSDMADEIGGIIEDYHNAEIDAATMETRILQSLEDGEFGKWVVRKVLRALVEAGIAYQ